MEQVVSTTLGQRERERRSTLQAVARHPHHQALANHSLEDHLKWLIDRRIATHLLPLGLGR
jgi:hypothetical protein